MKSNVIMKSSDRDLFGVTIRQQTKNQFISVTDLQKAYDMGKWQHGWSSQSISQLMQSERFAEKVYGVLKGVDLIKVDFPTFTEMVEREGIVKCLKGLGVWVTTGRAENKSVYADPYIWITLAMELNYIIYGQVVKWLTDSLIFDRIDAGSEFRPMNNAIKLLMPSPDYPKYARAINEKVFGFHQNGMRDIANSKQLRKIADIEKFVMNAISLGFIKGDADIISAINNYENGD